uniref:Uncharacterized protein n=1 Tax=Salix viminalis TaxID=40686 RepID=A0A6N2N535_SALVM
MNIYEAELIKKVVNDVACKLGNKTLHVAKHTIGIAGIGKTTIAKVVFNNLYFRFEGSGFLSVVKEISDKPNGVVELQERLLHDILKPNIWKIKQLEALMGERCWFGYHAMELDRDQSLQIFSLHAFRETLPVQDYEELSEKVVDYCKGLPLALKILGSHLSIRDSPPITLKNHNGIRELCLNIVIK